MLTARATTSPIVSSAVSACALISHLAVGVSGIVSVGLKAVALVNEVYTESTNPGRQSAGAHLGSVICTNRKSGAGWGSSARASGPPRSSCQYHSPNSSTLVTHSTMPDPISARPFDLPPCSRKWQRSTSEKVLAALTRPIRAIAMWRRSGEWRILGCGEASISPASASPSRAGSSQVGRIVSFSGSARSSRIAAAATSCGPQKGSCLASQAPAGSLISDWLESKLLDAQAGSDASGDEKKGMRVPVAMLTLLAALGLAACGGSTTTVSTRTVASSATTGATGTSTATTPVRSSTTANSSTTPTT